LAKLKIGIFNPYLDTFGGGEKDICVTAEALSDTYDVEIVSTKKVDSSVLERIFNVDLSRVGMRYVPMFRNRYSIKSLWKMYLIYLSKRYDIFYNLVNYPPWPSFARVGIMRVQFPFSGQISESDLKTRGYSHFFANSEFTRAWVKKRWGADADVLYPPVEMFSPGKKENIIMSAGRFFVGGHNKKHLLMMCAFKNLVNAGLKGWEYHLVGSVTGDPVSQAYLDIVRDFAKGYPIFIHANAPFSKLSETYSKCRIFVHATGYGESDSETPERFEHFGLTTVEAMSSGAVPVVIDAGGQKELVRDGVNGYLWQDEKTLARRLTELTSDETLRKKLAEEAVKTSRQYSRESFVAKVRELLESASAGL